MVRWSIQSTGTNKLADLDCESFSSKQTVDIDECLYCLYESWRVVGNSRQVVSGCRHYLVGYICSYDVFSLLLTFKT